MTPMAAMVPILMLMSAMMTKMTTIDGGYWRVLRPLVFSFLVSLFCGFIIDREWWIMGHLSACKGMEMLPWSCSDLGI
jgi:hypothetical protein